MIFTVETNYKDRIDKATTSDETGEILITPGFLWSEVIERAKYIDTDIKVSLVELKRKIFRAEELEYAITNQAQWLSVVVK